MPWGPRVTETSSNLAEGDKLYIAAQYNDTSGSLTAFMPVYKDFSDAAEFDSLNTATALTAGPLKGLQSAGKAVTATNVNAAGISAGGGGGLFMGIYSPTNPNDVPSTGDMIRLMRFGATPIQISSGFAPGVGDFIITSDSQNLAAIVQRRAASQPSFGQYIGRVLGTGGMISTGGVISPLPSGKLGFLVNGWVDK